jgi:asparagine synthase (glutamine-hydrolysing)
MCGIAGLFYRDAHTVPEMLQIQAMTDAISYRGPDGEGFHLAPGIALGHRRLAIIDPEGGHQPMFNQNRTVAIVFNGEIYNFENVRKNLESRGYVFQNRCDTETIIYAWEEYGEACVDHLSGMFAFALWDSCQKKLFCARDRLGKKPFYYSWIDGDFVFGSEIAALAALPGLSRAIRPQAVDDFFAYGYVPEPGTIFDAIHKLPPACTLTLDHSGAPPRIARYWTPAPRYGRG